MVTYGAVFTELRSVFFDAGIEAAALEARLISERASQKTREEYIRDSQLPAEGGFRKNAWEMMRRRLSGEPAAYILGEWEFYSLPFYVSSDTLIPRVDSEVLVSCALKLLSGRETPRVLDLCCGSGCLGTAVGVNIPDADLVFADYSGGALKICRDNLERNGLTGRAHVTYANALSSPHGDLMCGFDMILCNPPYIPTEELISLDKSVRDFEPLLALDGGYDGMRFYRSVASRWREALVPGGYLLFECGFGQAEAVQRILEFEGFAEISAADDTAGIPRVVISRKTL